MAAELFTSGPVCSEQPSGEEERLELSSYSYASLT